ncbi:peptidylprolyl isomerase [Tardiphaga alba]|uniref:Parvulin-like PPIase n=1 Tax=Tardiphaga alba TaxID=340268 RepID=A0ABX8A457_9BRAD|nr:peptidylprolyl isomerase [Tardiphaga alba]QUS38453.1 peptidylprolyl isomerase [Tardiphaga alba]
MSQRSSIALATVAGLAVASALVSPSLAQTAMQPGQPRVAQAPPAPARQPVRPAAPAAAAPAAPAASAVAAAKSSGEVVARIGNSDVTADDMRAFIAALGPRDQAAVAQDPALLSQAVRIMLSNRLVMQELVAKKYDKQPQIEAQLEKVRENALVEIYLQSVSNPPANFPGEDDLQKVYDANRASFQVPRQYQLAQIYVPVPKDADKATVDAAKKKADDVQRKLKAPGADFAAIARTESAAKESAERGGDLGLLPEDQIRPEIRTQIAGLAKGGVSDPITLDDGIHFIRLIDTKAAYTRTLPEVREQLVQQMRTQRAAVLRQNYLAELLKQKPPIINELALTKLLDGKKN